MLIGSLSRKKKQVVKLTSMNNNKRSWPCGLIAGLRGRRAEFGSRRGHEFFSFFFFFNLTTSMRVFSQINKCQQQQQQQKKQKQKQNKTKKKGGLRF